MTPVHHPSEAWLLDFSLGNLSKPFETVLNAHIGTCTECQESIRFAEALGGEFLSSMNAGTDAEIDLHNAMSAEPVALSTESRAMETVTANTFEHFVETYLHSSIGALRWRNVGRGLQICKLSDENDVCMWMLKAKPGTVLPDHTHLGAELTMVLKGAYFCGSEIFRAGDLEDADEETSHRPMVTNDGECVCLAVTEGKLQFNAWLPRLLQPLIGI